MFSVNMKALREKVGNVEYCCKPCDACNCTTCVFAVLRPVLCMKHSIIILATMISFIIIVFHRSEITCHRTQYLYH